MERRRKKRKRSLFSRLFFLIFIIIVVIGAGIYLLRLPIFNIKDVVVNGAQMLSPDEIRDLAGIPVSENLFFTKFTRAHNNLSKIAPIKSFRIYRLPPRTVLINIEERKPVAAMIFPTRSFIIDADGFIINSNPNITLNISNMEDLPVISEIDEKSVIEEGRIKPQMMGLVVDVIIKMKKFLAGSRIQLEPRDFKEISFLLDDLLKVKLGDAEHVKRKMQVFFALFSAIKGKWNQIEYVDVRVPDFPVVKYKLLNP